MSRARARVIAQARRRPDPLPWLPWLLLLSLLIAGSALAQTSASPGAGLPLAPPTQPLPGQLTAPSGQAAPDTPGGSTRNGVATPAPNPDPGINKGAPVPATSKSVIAPPGTPGGNPNVVPK